MKTPYYLASGLENITAVASMTAAMEEAGFTRSYDWSAHGSVQSEGLERIRDVAILESEGVKDATFTLVVLPGGSGTHVELGMALALGQHVYIYGPKVRYTGDTERGTCAFYHHPLVKWFFMEQYTPTEVANVLALWEDS